MQYFISHMFTHDKPFTKWQHAWIHYLPSGDDSVSEMSVGYFDMHIERFTHQPTAKELYGLLAKWRFYLVRKDTQILEAGIDEKLWFSTFGFPVDKQRFVQREQAYVMLSKNN
jgi:hypothetical protein